MIISHEYLVQLLILQALDSMGMIIQAKLKLGYVCGKCSHEKNENGLLENNLYSFAGIPQQNFCLLGISDDTFFACPLESTNSMFLCCLSCHMPNDHYYHAWKFGTAGRISCSYYNDTLIKWYACIIYWNCHDMLINQMDVNAYPLVRVLI